MLNKLKQTWRRILRVRPHSAGAAAPVLPVGLRFRACLEVAAEALGDELVLVHMGQGSTFRLNRTGKRVWELIREGRTAEEVVALLHDAWPVPNERLEADVRRVLADLVREQLLQPIAERAE